MIERDGDTVRLVLNPRGVAVTNGAVIVFGVVAIGLGVLAAIGPLLGQSPWVEILAVFLIGVGVFAIVAVVRGGRDHEVLELDSTTLRLRRGDEVIESVPRTSITSLHNFVSIGTSKTTGLLTAYDGTDDVVAQWHLDTAWSKKQFDDFLEATGIRDRAQR